MYSGPSNRDRLTLLERRCHRRLCQIVGRVKGNPRGRVQGPGPANVEALCSRGAAASGVWRDGRSYGFSRGVAMPWVFPGGKEPISINAGDVRNSSLIPGLGRSPGGGNGNPLQNSHLENPMDRGAWWAVVQGVAKSWTQLNN